MRLRPALILLIVGLVPRLWLLFLNLDHQDRWYTPDSYGYRQIALNLIHHGAYSQLETPPLFPDFDRTPVYPAFLAALLAISGDRMTSVVVVQIILSVLTAVFVFFAARIALSRTAAGISPGRKDTWALATALAFTLSLSSIASSQQILTETLFTFLLALQLCAGLAYLQRPDTRLVVAATALLALMTLCRPISLPWIAVQVFLIACAVQVRWPRRLGHIALSVILFAALLFPWYLRNRVLDGAWFFTVNTGNTMLLHDAAGIEAKRTGESADSLRARWLKEIAEEAARRPEEFDTAHERNEHLVRRAREIFRRSPALYLRTHMPTAILLPNINTFFELIGLTSGQRGTLDILNREGLLAAVRHYFGGRAWLILLVAPWIALLGLIYLGAAIGLMVWAVRRRWDPLLLFAAFVLYYLVLPGAAGEPRFLLPAMPMLVIAAAAGWHGVCPRVSTAASV